MYISGSCTGLLLQKLLGLQEMAKDSLFRGERKNSPFWKIFQSMLCLDIHNRSRKECLVSPVATSRAGCIYSFSNSIYFLPFSSLWLSWESQDLRLAAGPLQQGFAGESSPFCVLSVPAYSQWPVPFCVFQPAVASHPQPTAFMLQKLPSCIWSYWILPCMSWRNPGIPRQPFSVLSYPFLWPHTPNILQPDKGKFTDQLGLPT